MNAVIDEDLPRTLADTLSNLGFSVFDVRDHGLREITTFHLTYVGKLY